MNKRNNGRLFAAGILRNFIVQDAKGTHVVIQAKNVEVARERVSIVAEVIEGGIVTPVTVALHEGKVTSLWFSDAFFSSEPVRQHD